MTSLLSGHMSKTAHFSGNRGKRQQFHGRLTPYRQRTLPPWTFLHLSLCCTTPVFQDGSQSLRQNDKQGCCPSSLASVSAPFSAILCVSLYAIVFASTGRLKSEQFSSCQPQPGRRRRKSEFSRIVLFPENA